MAQFGEFAQQKVLEWKLLELSNSQQSVQTLSLWLIHHRKHSVLIVSMWEQELRKAAAEAYACVWTLTHSSC
uniref:CID domain-containing protein n=1 Tax=Pavo cristatus TaxID=9049 RepID=A0A8C9LE59_PAVCR